MALFCASYMGHDANVQWLLKHGANVNLTVNLDLEAHPEIQQIFYDDTIITRQVGMSSPIAASTLVMSR